MAFSKETQDKIDTTRLMGQELIASLGKATRPLPDKFKFHCYDLVRQTVSRKCYKLIHDSIVCPVQNDSSILVELGERDLLFNVIWENAFIGSFTLQELMQTSRYKDFIFETWDIEDSNSLFKQVSDIINKKTAEDMQRLYKAFDFEE